MVVSDPELKQQHSLPESELIELNQQEPLRRYVHKVDTNSYLNFVNAVTSLMLLRH